MRTIFILLFGLIQFKTNGQKWMGNYYDHFGHRVEFHKDSTFKYDYGLCLTHNWGIGKWTKKKDTIYLRFDDSKVYDTLVRANHVDSLIESNDEISSRIDEKSFAMQQYGSGGQLNGGVTRLMIGHRKLYFVDNNGRRVKGRQEAPTFRQKKWWGYKKWPLWYVKEKQTVHNKS